MQGAQHIMQGPQYTREFTSNSNTQQLHGNSVERSYAHSRGMQGAPNVASQMNIRGSLPWLFLEPTMNNEPLGNKNCPDFFS